MFGTRSQLLPRAVLLTGLAAWMTVAVLNNITDTGTNLIHLDNMLSMRLLIEDPIFGNGLEWRAWNGVPAQAVLWIVICWQVLTAAALWWAAVNMIGAFMKGGRDEACLRAVNLALSMFLGLWLVFLCGGLWFGYWMKQGAIQGVHLTLVIVSLMSLTYLNQPLQGSDTDL
ncbi:MULTISPECIES: DUF2165 family protein [Pseudovibrio]|uniref:DUF2165 family protein n=1 Tax=Stappiaceae TaxID=2821832 RepID=UPI002366F189|nr:MULTISPECIES: DUF2165 family protein [Pseudovibrio]MDD7911075.1 DUF2165 family protein [Pseudovibrio exalbescens]MDX5595688.1 DUF2165 family protein [Pseudovibrio sp. SPO723]